jgi:alkyl hydroperoxide reductase subunit AhpC
MSLGPQEEHSMATLCLVDDSRNNDPRVPELAWGMAPGLRDWLAGDWGLLFSHPDDFQYSGFEFDRWLEVMRAEFDGRGVRPLALAADERTRDGSWVSALTDDARRIRVHGAHEVVDLPARLLLAALAALARLRGRFVVIVEPTLRRRGVLRYGAGCITVSPLDLLASIEAMRRPPAPRRAAA